MSWLANCKPRLTANISRATSLMFANSSPQHLIHPAIAKDLFSQYPDLPTQKSWHDSASPVEHQSNPLQAGSITNSSKSSITGMKDLTLNAGLAHVAGLCTATLEPWRGQVAGFCTATSEPRRAEESVTERAFRELQEARKQYRAEVSLLRKHYAEEHAAKQRQKARAEKEKRDLLKKAQASQVEAKKEQAAARRQLMMQQQEELKRAKEVQRLRNEALRLKKEEQQARKKADQLEGLKNSSRTWVQPDQLDRRIAEAMSDPYQL